MVKKKKVYRVKTPETEAKLRSTVVRLRDVIRNSVKHLWLDVKNRYIKTVSGFKKAK